MSQQSMPGMPDIPKWLRFVLIADRAGSAWYIGAGFFRQFEGDRFETP